MIRRLFIGFYIVKPQISVVSVRLHSKQPKIYTNVSWPISYLSINKSLNLVHIFFIYWKNTEVSIMTSKINRMIRRSNQLFICSLIINLFIKKAQQNQLVSFCVILWTDLHTYIKTATNMRSDKNAGKQKEQRHYVFDENRWEKREREREREAWGGVGWLICWL